MRAVHEVLVVSVLVTAVTVAVSWLGRLPALADYVGLTVAALFLWTALALSQRQPDGVRRYGLSLAGLLDAPHDEPRRSAIADLLLALARATPSALRELAWALALALAIFPPFVAGFWLYHQPSHAFALSWPKDPAGYVLAQILVVALPEEALYRGYVQSRLAEGFGDEPRRVLGAALPLRAWVLQAILFALIHFAVELSPARLAVFFPALVFGWLRARRGGVGAAAAFHALCNLLSDTLVRGWL